MKGHLEEDPLWHVRRACPITAPLLMSQHCAFEPEFRAIVASLPVRPGDRVLDLACGDGAYSRWLAERGTSVLAVDVSRDFSSSPGTIIRPRLRPIASVSCGEIFAGFLLMMIVSISYGAQSLYSLPDPLDALQKMRQKTKPGGFVAVIENDEFHHVLLPWPIEIELALCRAQLAANIKRSRSRASSMWAAGSASCSITPA